MANETLTEQEPPRKCYCDPHLEHCSVCQPHLWQLRCEPFDLPKDYADHLLTPALAEPKQEPALGIEQGLAVMVLRLVRRIRKVCPTDDISNQAIDYLKRLDLPKGSPLRDESSTNHALKTCVAELKQEWIKCSERLPPDGDEVLVWEVDYGALVAAKAISPEIPWYVRNWDASVAPEITHWMPLPEPPKEE